jgi:UDP:flavonoid glycosyltransferase YjiC (YdhE family)
MVPDLVAHVRRWQADVLVHDIIDFAAPIAGELTETPYAGFNWSLRLPGGAGNALYRDEWEALRRTHGLPSDPDGQALWRFLILDFVPPGYQIADTVPAPTGHPISPLLFDHHGEHPLPAWVSELGAGARPTVYATLGTVFNRTPGLLQKIIDSLADEDISLVVTVGSNQDPESFGPQPENVHIERYIPQTALFPSCAAVVTHGGYNTVMTALAHGLPMVITPISADQIFHSTRCAELGAALVVEPAELDAEQLRQALRRLLKEPGFRKAAGGMRAEIESLPGIERGVELIEELAEARTPRLAGGISVSPD